MNLNVIACTNRPNLYERLENIQERLSLCEKALAEYLETKRLCFPRFYFFKVKILLKGSFAFFAQERVQR